MPEVLIVGGGISGLCCALQLHKAGRSIKVLESADQVGGRARTESFEGFLLDRGFQVLLTAYPEAKEVLDYDDLQLKSFEPGALVRFNGKFHRFSDPWRRPQHLLATALSPVATIMDKLRVARFRSRVCRGTLDDLNAKPDETTISRLQAEGFSGRIIQRFFRPFLGGVFLESELKTSSRKLEFVFRMFSQGDAAIPVDGISGIANQLAAKLPADTIQTGATVTEVTPHSVRLSDGTEFTAEKIVLACEAPATAKLLGEDSPSQAHGTTCIYFSADAPPLDEAILVLNGDGSGPINNLCVQSALNPQCAPAGKSLISVTVIGVAAPDQKQKLHQSIVAQLVDWYGSEAESWKHLKTFEIPYALPIQNPNSANASNSGRTSKDGIIVCGDHLENASIQGAMVSGRRAAERVLAN